MGVKKHNFMERLMFHTHIMFSHLDRQLSVIQSVPKNQAFQKKTTREHVDIEWVWSAHHHGIMFPTKNIHSYLSLNVFQSHHLPNSIDPSCAQCNWRASFWKCWLRTDCQCLWKASQQWSGSLQIWWWWLLYATSGNQMKQPNMNNQIKWTIKWSNWL